MQRFFVILFFILVASVVVAAEDDPEAATRAYFEALSTAGLIAAPDFMHPAELEKFKAMLLPVYESEAEAGNAQFRSATFGDAATIADVRDASGEEFMRAVLRLVNAQMSSAGGIDFDSVEVLGSIEENNGLVHVVARTTIGVGELKVSQVEVISWRADKHKWRTVLSGELEGLARQLQMQLGQ